MKRLLISNALFALIASIAFATHDYAWMANNAAFWINTNLVVLILRQKE